MAYYLLNCVRSDPARGSAMGEVATALLAVGMWGVDEDEPHGDALEPGDLALVYTGAPERVFLGRSKLASSVHDWTPSEAHVYPGRSSRGVLLTHVELWDPPVPMATVLARIAPSDKARADFPMGVVRITEDEYETTLSLVGGPA